MFPGQVPPRARPGGLDRRLVRRLTILAVALVLFAGSFRFWAGALAARAARSMIASRLKTGVAIDKGRASLSHVTFYGLRLGDPGKAPFAIVDRIDVPYEVAWGTGRVDIDGARFEIERGGPNDNISDVLARLSSRTGGGGSSSSGKRKIPELQLRGGTVRARDTGKGAAAVIEGLAVHLVPGARVDIETTALAGIVRVRGGESDPKFGAGRLKLSVPLDGLHPLPMPTFEVNGGYVEPLSNLGLTGIRGTITPSAAAGAAQGSAADRLVVKLEGSYGGARETLWTASGEVKPPARGESGRTSEFQLALRAARFTLDRVKDILPPTVLDPAKTSVDGALDLHYAGGKLDFKGNLEVSGLNLHHDAVASEPVMGLNLGLTLDGQLDPERRRVDLAKLEGRFRGLVGTLSGAVELTPGKFHFGDGHDMPMVPKIDLRLTVPRIPCAKLIESIPGPIIPHLQGFVLQGQFEADVYTKIDYANLEALELGGKVGIDGCKVITPPDEVMALVGPDSITQIVEIPSDDKNAPAGATEMLAFPIGPDNPNFVPYDKISPYLISSILTTEDSGFFKHHGWVSPEFKTALKRNLAGGGFRLGASSITMQMTKNVLLSREKTLSRKLQELFLVWYIEKLLPKERILELYFNAIEFGPRIYGIGAAAKHYFGKSASDLNPLEGAFFSSILPSPKRRYIQYCHGQLYPPWDKYIRRILAKVHERNRVTDDEYNFAMAQPLVFDLTARTTTEAECLNWVKKITSPLPEREVPQVEADN